MSIYKFKEEEIFVNVLKMYPKYEFVAYDGKVYINNQVADSGSFVAESLCVPSGYISLYEKNIDKLYLLYCDVISALARIVESY